MYRAARVSGRRQRLCFVAAISVRQLAAWSQSGLGADFRHGCRCLQLLLLGLLGLAGFSIADSLGHFRFPFFGGRTIHATNDRGSRDCSGSNKIIDLIPWPSIDCLRTRARSLFWVDPKNKKEKPKTYSCPLYYKDRYISQLYSSANLSDLLSHNIIYAC